LSVSQLLPALSGALANSRSAVLQAPPGAGKSTVVPLALLQEPWLRRGRVLMLEPRRLAARAVACRMADTLGEPVGQTVGYRMRLDTRVSGATRLEVLTEGVLTRMLADDPALEGVSLVIFDEFHERSLQADLGLALTLQARELLNPELRILVMSATLDGDAAAALLGDAEVIAGDGRQFPVETRYACQGPPMLPGAAFTGTGAAAAERLEQRIARIVRTACTECAGDILVFLPGAAEIRRTAALLEPATPPARTRVLPLYGDLDQAAQDEALSPSLSGVRRIVLATNIAETSLTIAGIHIVVDSGLVRRSVFDPVTGMSRLETRRISRASAEQRQGRAGRTAPGVCYRAWSEGAHQSLIATTPPEIIEADLAPLALELANWGAHDAHALAWLDPPPDAMLACARDLLMRLGAIDERQRITAEGRAMAALGVHPRLAHMLLASRRTGAVSAGARIAAFLSDHDALRRGQDADVTTRLTSVSRHTQRLAQDLQKRLATLADGESGRSRTTRNRTDADGSSARPAVAPKTEAMMSVDEAAGVLLAYAYPDRIGRRRPGHEPRYLLANGRGARFAHAAGISSAPFIVAVDVDDRDREGVIRLAARLERAALDTHFGAQMASAQSVTWDSREQAVIARSVIRLGNLIIEEKPLPEIPADAATEAMFTGIRAMGISALSWDDASRDLQARILFARNADAKGDWPAVDDASLSESIEQWLTPWLAGCTRREHLTRIPMTDAIRAMLSHEQQQTLNRVAPARLEMPSGSQVRVDYRSDNAPVVSVRLQEVFGLAETPRIADGRVPVTFELLSPARRPVQITQDLASFWASGYAQVRRDLRGRYPKHYWPDDPLQAEAIRGVRPQKDRSRP
jgi:ATP-dependent helicase HrpB